LSNSENTSSDNESIDFTESDDQLNVELSAPIITPPILIYYSDDYFRATFTVTNNWPAGYQHTFRVYAYLDYIRSDTGSGNKFADGDSVKKKGPFEYWPNNDPDPYDTIPFTSEMNPDEGFMGPERKKIFSRDAQLTSFAPYLFTAECDNPLSPDHSPGQIYFVVQMLWRADELIPWTFTYWARYYWVTHIYSIDMLLKNMQIYDDDTDPPVIPTESMTNPWFDPVSFNPFVIDNMETFQLDVCAYDQGASGPHPLNAITFGDFNVFDGEYLSGQDELIEWDVYGNDIYAYWYRYNIPNDFEPGVHTVELKVWEKDYDGWPGDRLSASIDVTFSVVDDDTEAPDIDCTYTGDGTDGNPGELIVTASDASGLSVDPTGIYPVPNSLGTHHFSFTATDNDNDRPNDALTNTVEISIEIVDDDTLKPVIDVIYTGDGTDGNPGDLIVTASDPSGLLVDPSGTYPVPNSLGIHDFTFTATDNDNDRPDDRLTKTLDVPITIVDDDEAEPYFENLVITDDHLWLNISFNVIDDSGLSIIKIYVDDVLIHTYFPTPTEDTFFFSFINEWIWELGIYNVQIDITDADLDRPSDSLSNTAYRQFEVTLDALYQYVMWLCEEINNYIYDNEIVALYGVVTQKLVKIQTLLWEAYQLIQDGYLHTGLVRQKMAEIKLEIADTKTELMINKQSMTQEHFDHLKECIRDVRNRIVELMGLCISPFSHEISFVEIDVYNLRDLVEENIPATDSENLVNAITLTAEKLENAIFDISLDKSTERSLTSAQNALDNARIEVIALAGKGKISEALKTTLLIEIVSIQGKIQLLKLEI